MKVRSDPGVESASPGLGACASKAVEKFAWRYVECGCEPEDRRHTGIALAVLDPGHLGGVDAATATDLLLSQRSPPACFRDIARELGDRLHGMPILL
jgi:hypothetical protein